MVENLNHPVVVIALLGVALGGVGSLLREVMFGVQRLTKNSALDRNAKVLEEIVVSLQLMNAKMQSIEHQAEKTYEAVMECTKR